MRETEREMALIYLMAYQLLMGYLIPKLDLFVNTLLLKRRRRKNKRKGEKESAGLICLMAYQLFMGYLMLKFDSFVYIWK